MGDPLLGRTLGGKFTLESLLGTGAMGAVYRARHVALDTVVAVKVMHDDIAVDHTFAERFHREARAASRLDHPNVIRVVDFGLEPDGHLYIVMEYVEGYDLFQVIRRDSPLSEKRIIDLLSQALSGIAAAHDMGVVHRDLKPENIMVATRVGDDGEYEVVKVCDFGIAQFSEPARTAPGSVPHRTLTARGVLLGTPQYMSPEQARGEVTDARTDVYSLGVILYQLLTGQLPFEGPTPIDTVLKHVSEEPVPPTELVPTASPLLEAVCLKALAKRREGRWASAREMRGALRSERSSTPTKGTRDPLVSREPPPVTKSTTTSSSPALASPHGDLVPETMPSFRRGPSRNVLYAGGALGVIVLLGAGVFVAGKDDADPAPPPVQPTIAQVPPKSAPAPALTTTAESAPTHAAEEPAPQRPGKATATRRSATPWKPPESTQAIAAAERNLSSTSDPYGSPRPEPVAAPVETAPTPTPSTSKATPVPAATGPTPLERAATEAPTPFVVRAGSSRVKWHVAQVGGGATSGDVTRALSRAATSWNGCYENGLRSRARRVEGKGTLRLNCDDQGRVVSATFSGSGMSDVAACIQSSVTGIRISNADTGEAWATVAVTLAVSD